jgi:hypothetical protein
VLATGRHFVATWRKGKWKKAEEVPGLAKLNKDGAVYPGSLSCATAGNCVAAGAYLDGSGHFQVFEVVQRAGTWRTAVEVPGAAKLNVDGEADVYQVACASPGNCALAGYYRDKAGHFDPFTAEVHSWKLLAAQRVPGISALDKDGLAELNAVACVRHGRCAAGGYFRDGSGRLQGYVVSEN